MTTDQPTEQEWKRTDFFDGSVKYNISPHKNINWVIGYFIPLELEKQIEHRTRKQFLAQICERSTWKRLKSGKEILSIDEEELLCIMKEQSGERR